MEECNLTSQESNFTSEECNFTTQECKFTLKECTITIHAYSFFLHFIKIYYIYKYIKKTPLKREPINNIMKRGSLFNFITSSSELPLKGFPCFLMLFLYSDRQYPKHQNHLFLRLFGLQFLHFLSK